MFKRNLRGLFLDKEVRTGNARGPYIFDVKSGFPRVVDLPKGVGDITYSLTVSACSDFELRIDDAANNFIGT